MQKQFETLKDRPEVKLRVTRDSVCAGDDCHAPHERFTYFHSFTDPEAFIKQLSDKYLPNVAGIGHTWDCLLNGKCVGLVTNQGIKICAQAIDYSETNTVFFKYNSATY